MMIESNFLYCENKALKTGAGLILSLNWPYCIAKVFRFDNGQQLATFLDKYDLHGTVGRVAGYNIIIAMIGTIHEFDNEFLPIHGTQLKPETFNDLKQMNEFYDNEKIKGNETRLKKYKA